MYIEQKDGTLLGMKTMPDAVKIDGDGDIKLLVSTEAVDSDGDVVHQRRSKYGEGWKLDRFNRAPVVTWQHDLRVPNLSGPRTKAKVSKLGDEGARGTGLWGLFLNPLQFDEGDVFAMELDGKYRREVLKESSVGFMVLDWQPRVVDGKREGMDIYTSELVEVATANRGANPETATLAKNLTARFALFHEDEGSSMVKDMAEELDNLRQLVTVFGNELKALGDKVDGRVETFDEVEAAKAIEEHARQQEQAAAEELLAVLKSRGIAHS